MERNIGKKVWLFYKVKYSTYLNKAKTYEIVKVLTPDECKDYCYHYVVKDNDGKEKEVREWEVVFTPQVIDNRVNICKYLADNRCWAEELSENEETVILSISWGDWKHDHGWCDNLMSYIGYTCKDEVVTEENGSDCYSSDHYYIKNK